MSLCLSTTNNVMRVLMTFDDEDHKQNDRCNTFFHAQSVWIQNWGYSADMPMNTKGICPPPPGSNSPLNNCIHYGPM